MAEKTITVPFALHEKVVYDGRAAEVDHLQLTKDGRTLFYITTTDAEGKTVELWVNAYQLADVAA